jgi:hypothetical protein
MLIHPQITCIAIANERMVIEMGAMLGSSNNFVKIDTLYRSESEFSPDLKSLKSSDSVVIETCIS